ncbi:MAG: (d)CMP kinase [Deltaproteobacteria bacterium]|nr:(d)CMP kinase [Deltaproteobacteria bacterium]
MAAKLTIITIDGPAGAGKSTLARRLARKLGWIFLDTGALYRCVALVLRDRGRPEAAEDEAVRTAAGLDLDFRLEDGEQKLLLEGRFLGEEIRTPEISRLASYFSAMPGVRLALLPLQRRLGEKGFLVTEGRDMGTVVFPEAGLKFFLMAAPEIRARRRFLELQQKGLQADYQKELADLKLRDSRDQNRSTAPLVWGADTEVIDSSCLELEDVLALMYQRAAAVFNL